jgi:Spy/CpxP family protein refolding chaperone
MLRTLRRTALLLALAAPALSAQQAGEMDHSAHAQHMAKPKLDDELAQHFKGITLTDAQVKQVAEIKAKHHKAMDALKKEAKDPEAPALKLELQKHMDAEHAEFLSLLTAEQRKVFAENMKEHHKAEAKPGMKEGAHATDHKMDHGTPKKPLR